MGTDLQAGNTYVDGQQVTAANLNAHVNDAEIKYTAISARTLKSPASMGDEMLINDAGVLRKITVQQIHTLVTTLIVVPPGTVADFAGPTAPSGWFFCYGQQVSRTTYAALFAAIGGYYGSGDGSTTFNLPDCRGRVTAGMDNMGGVAAGRMSNAGGGINGQQLGGAGGAQWHQLTQAEMPAHQHAGGMHAHNNPAHQHYTSYGHTHAMYLGVGGYVGASYLGGFINQSTVWYNFLTSPTLHTASGTHPAAAGWSDAGYGATQTDWQQGTTDVRGSSNAHLICQPTIIFNKIIKV